jgi:competence protein ComEA
MLVVIPPGFINNNLILLCIIHVHYACGNNEIYGEINKSKKPVKQIIRDYLTFNKRERNGVFVLLSIIILLIVYLNISDKFFAIEKVDLSEFEKEMDSLNLYISQGSLNSEIINTNVSVKNEKANPSAGQEFFDFDPNNLSEESWQKLGFTTKQIKTIKNYEAKGGKFKKKNDLKKMYCIKPEQYESLEPFIKIIKSPPVFENGQVRSDSDIPKISPEQNKNSNSSIKINPVAVLELNSADSVMLTTIKGIGAFYAKTIIKYRNSLGGFYSKEQLLEVWKFDQEKLNSIEKYISVDDSKIKKININTCEADQLKGPYIKWNIANAIVNYRKQHGSFKTIYDITKTDLVDDETLRKIAPYLILE